MHLFAALKSENPYPLGTRIYVGEDGNTYMHAAFHVHAEDSCGNAGTAAWRPPSSSLQREDAAGALQGFGIIIHEWSTEEKVGEGEEEGPEGFAVKKLIPLGEEHLFGHIASAEIFLGKHGDRSVLYRFYSHGKAFPDKYSKSFANHIHWGDSVRPESFVSRCCPEEKFDWQGDAAPGIPYNKSIFYCLHVRAFTRHSSSGVRGRGTFHGISEKAEYLRDLGVTSLVLMPAYTFAEYQPELPLGINCWGFKEGYYFAPNQVYSKDRDAITEFRDMVRELHRNGMECIMQLYFRPETPGTFIADVMEYWRIEFHVDGFQLKGSGFDLRPVYTDALLKDLKIITDEVPGDIPSTGYSGDENAPGVFQLYYQDILRSFLKGDENLLGEASKLFTHMPYGVNRVNRIADFQGFRLLDLYSYERKHNEENGENNNDGEDLNRSWNCGVEGKTRREKILGLRMRLIKNALTSLAFSAGSPYIFMGDERGSGQNGNNNPYCQDNDIFWLDWRLNSFRREILDFTSEVFHLRQEIPAFCRDKNPAMTDHRSLGLPDISCHGTQVWKPEYKPYCRELGILYNGNYYESEGTFYYLVMNMHWTEKDFSLPPVNCVNSCLNSDADSHADSRENSDKNSWKIILCTENGRNTKTGIRDKDGRQELHIGERTMVLLVNRSDEADTPEDEKTPTVK